MTTISIALATYNGARFIREQLDSLVAQTYLPSELVVTDDGSTDTTIEIVTQFAQRAPFLVRVSKNVQRLGFRANFMNCASFCSGNLIAFCDQDDVWQNNKLEGLVKHFDDPSILLACHNVALIDEHGSDLGHTVHKIDKTGKNAFRDLLPFAYCHGFTQIFRRDLLAFSKYWINSADCVEPNQPMAHDQFYVFVALLLGHVYYDDAVLAFYRQHGGNATGNIVVHSPLASIGRKFLDRADQYRDITFLTRNRLELLKLLSADAVLTKALPDAHAKLEEATLLYRVFSRMHDKET